MGVQFIGRSHAGQELAGYSLLEAFQQHPEAGTVCIPDRPGEVQRLQDRKDAGAAWATSQILFDPPTFESPLPTWWSVAPVQQDRDVAFLRRLRCQVPALDPAALHERSLALAGSLDQVLVTHVMQDLVPRSRVLVERAARGQRPANPHSRRGVGSSSPTHPLFNE